MPTYLFLSNGTQANGDHSCPVRRRFEEFTSHQLDMRRPTVHANLGLKCEQSERVTPGHLLSGAYYVESSKPTRLLHFQLLLFSCCDPYGVAARASYSGDPFAAPQRVFSSPSQVQLMRGEFLETAPYWAGVVSVCLGAIAEKKASQHSCVWGSV